MNRKIYVTAILFLGSVLGLIGVVIYLSQGNFNSLFNVIHTIEFCSQIGTRYCDTVTKGFYALFIWSLLFLPATLLLERLFPVNVNQKMFSIGFHQDFMWYLLGRVFRYTGSALYSMMLYTIYNTYLSGLRIQYIQQLPVAAQVMMVILGVDFLAWFSHMIRHRVSIFWEFHKLHHSQREMSFFSHWRLHPVDGLINQTIVFIPLASLQLDIAIPTFLAWNFFRQWTNMFYHANIKTDLGWLRYMIVTPQSHRIHHSLEEDHFDKNFADVFSIWDYIFGTQHRKYDEYPETGIVDPNFPLEYSPALKDVIVTAYKQLIYPFTQIHFFRHAAASQPQSMPSALHPTASSWSAAHHSPAEVVSQDQP